MDQKLPDDMNKGVPPLLKPKPDKAVICQDKRFFHRFQTERRLLAVLTAGLLVLGMLYKLGVI